MKRAIVIIGLVLLLVGCSNKCITYNGKQYECIDLSKGIYIDDKGGVYTLGYSIKDGELKLYLVEKK